MACRQLTVVARRVVVLHSLGQRVLLQVSVLDPCHEPLPPARAMSQCQRNHTHTVWHGSSVSRRASASQGSGLVSRPAGPPHVSPAQGT
eukprot:204483-Rhodomonas_salina.1